MELPAGDKKLDSPPPTPSLLPAVAVCSMVAPPSILCFPAAPILTGFPATLTPPSLEEEASHLGLFVCLFSFLGPNLGHMDIPRLGVELELEMPAYTTATATRSELYLGPIPQLMAIPDP